MRKLKKLAEAKSLSVATYIKCALFEDEFSKNFKKLIERVSNIKNPQKFNVKMVFGLEWANISKGTKLALGKSFYKFVDAGKAPNVICLTKDSANTQWYEKIK